MHAGRHYSLREIATWTRRETALFMIAAAIPTALYSLAGWKWLGMSWQPIAVVGAAVAFMTGFKNNASYSRLWEARQVWGSLVNTSRTFALLTLDIVPGEADRKRIFYRHFAWLTALRYQLREPRVWENMREAYNTEYQRNYTVAEWQSPLEPELAALLVPAEHEYVLARKNRALHVIALQSKDLRQYVEATVPGELRWLELERQLAAFIDAQGRCERLKNFPYPRQFATLNLMFVWLFVILVPLGLLPEFQKLGGAFVWLTVPVGVVVAWVFHTMDKIGESSENPFEGGPNDVPITALCRTIEIDLRELLGEQQLPAALQPTNQILM
jgi:putative membrane protein